MIPIIMSIEASVLPCAPFVFQLQAADALPWTTHAHHWPDVGPALASPMEAQLLQDFTSIDLILSSECFYRQLTGRFHVSRIWDDLTWEPEMNFDDFRHMFGDVSCMGCFLGPNILIALWRGVPRTRRPMLLDRALPGRQRWGLATWLPLGFVNIVDAISVRTG